MQNEENKEQLSPENLQQVNLSFLRTVSFLIIMGVRWEWVGNRGQSSVGGNQRDLWCLQKCKCKTEILNPGESGLFIFLISNLICFKNK